MTNILIVDDDPTDLLLVGDILEDQGYRVFTATSGSRSLEMARSHQPDLILLDISMPDMDGLAVLQQLKSESLTRSIPVIFLTAFGHSANVVKGLQMGADEYISKPIRDDRELVARIGTVLRIRRSESRAIRLAEQLQAMQSVVAAINEGLELSSTLEKVVRSTALLGEFDWTGVVLDDGPLFLFSDGVRPEAQRLLTDGPMHHILAKGETLIINDVSQVADDKHQALWQASIGAYIGVPINHRNAVRGVLYALSNTPRTFSSEQVQAVEGIGMHAVIAIENARLYEQIKSLEQAKTLMLSMASHDLRNPLTIALNSISMLTEDLHSDRLSESEYQLLHLAERGLNQMQALIEDILTPGRIDAMIQQGAQTIEIENIVQQVVDAAQLQGFTNQQKLIFSPPPEIHYIRGYAQPLREAIVNLVSNAMKYTPVGGTIQVRIQELADEVQVEVEDNGLGIPAEKQVHLFEPFYRAHQPGAENISGTGLGLSLVKQVAEQHGGRVWVRSVSGQGSTFGIGLPRVEN